MFITHSEHNFGQAPQVATHAAPQFCGYCRETAEGKRLSCPFHFETAPQSSAVESDTDYETRPGKRG